VSTCESTDYFDSIEGDVALACEEAAQFIIGGAVGRSSRHADLQRVAVDTDGLRTSSSWLNTHRERNASGYVASNPFGRQRVIWLT